MATEFVRISQAKYFCCLLQKADDYTSVVVTIRERECRKRG